MIILSSAYLAPVQYYTKLYSGMPIIEERHDHFVKQTYRNRCTIATAQGPLSLSIPVKHNGGEKIRTGEVLISNHGKWRSEHWHALVSAYDNSPYFAYYADDFKAVYDQDFECLVDFNEAMENLVCDLLSISPHKQISDHYVHPEESDIDLRELIRPKVKWNDQHFKPAPYYQVFQEKYGFLPNLSIVDLLFNMGPESRIVLRNSWIR
ncbi:hypothetical protein C7Y71_007710 [Pseudoprevotella muciniphila]|uniref:WbqC family protein n=1 Tax=Pseudoprevotella muciniphila TaxID=2133944 RepID=A0A5P8E7G5_9BACT|nr:WbqC family protein [Pseudoprevotella muciniphila]QFQ12913.1 hypothetical protein C7Y71_007710 [Pseudoprevotella muciniphila]